MAYNFVRANTSYLYGNLTLSSFPYTFSAWIYTSIDNLGMTILSSHSSSNTLHDLRIYVAGNVAGDPVGASTRSSLTQYAALSTIGYQTNTWQHICGVFDSTTSRTVYLNGANNSTNTTSDSPTNLDRVSVGGNYTGGGFFGNLFEGNICEIAIWTASLNTDEINSLYKGFVPKKIRPQSLQFYSPLLRDLIEYKGNISLTNNSSTISTHNRMFL